MNLLINYYIYYVNSFEVNGKEPLNDVARIKSWSHKVTANLRLKLRRFG